MQAHQKRGLAISALGLTMMLLGGFSTAKFRYQIAPSRFIVNPMNIETNVDESRIVVGSMFAKVHVLDAEGRPQAHWQIPTEGGRFRLSLASDDRIHVGTRETGLLLEYDFSGELLSESEDSEAYERIGPEHELGFTAASGTQYLLEEGQIVRARGEVETVLVDGFANHEAITLRMIGMGLSLFVGVLLVVGGFVSTGKPQT